MCGTEKCNLLSKFLLEGIQVHLAAKLGLGTANGLYERYETI